MGDHTDGYNNKTIGIGFIGNFDETAPNEGMIGSTRKFFKDAIELGKLSTHYNVSCGSDAGSVFGTGQKFCSLLRDWKEYYIPPT